MLPKIICLMGPTAAGKTQLAIDLVQHHPLEIISVDSAMVYRGMDIGTAKPDAATLALAPHRLIDIRDPADAYSAAQFRKDAQQAMDEIIAQGKTPLLVGGTMMYFSILEKGLALMPAANPTLRAQLTAEANAKGWAVLHARLVQIDPIAASRIHPNDAQRLQRALEVYELTGKNLTSWQSADADKLKHYDILHLAIAPTDRIILHERIAQRFAEMLNAGFIEEVKNLMARGDLNLATPALRAVGYRQVWEYLSDACSYTDMQVKGIAATRQLAKRQLTWLRHWSEPVIWFDSLAPELFATVNAKVTQFIQ